jgi:hypothetical protein
MGSAARLNCLLSDICGSSRVITDLAQFEQRCREARLCRLTITISSTRFVSDSCELLQRFATGPSTPVIGLTRAPARWGGQVR